MNEELIAALRSALAAAPDNAGVRLQLGVALVDAGEPEEALLHARGVLVSAPDDRAAIALAARAASEAGDDAVAGGFERLLGALGAEGGDRHARYEQKVDDYDGAIAGDGLYLVDPPGLTLSDVGGMDEVKGELERSFLAPMRNPELSAHYGAEVGGGLLLFGPPGCGKTLLARAVAGELGAQFLSLGLHDVLDMWMGQSEKLLHAAFAEARRRAPCVVFFDEIDALGQKRGHLKGHSARNVVNQLLAEMDGISSHGDDGVFVLAATNHPWDVDGALRRPGRFDRSVLVLPPDKAARAAILALHLRERPTADLDYRSLARASEGYSGADLELACRTAAASVMGEAAARGSRRPIENRDLEAALREVKPSTNAWFQLAYNFAAFANEGGVYDDLLVYIRRRKLV